VPDRRRALLIAIVANLIGGSSYVATKIALGGLGETTIVVLRTVVALAVLVPLTRGRLGPLLSAGGPDRRHLLAMGVLGYALPLVLGSHGLRRSSAANAALLIGTEPLSVVVLSALVLGESLGRARLIALGLGVAGATVLVTNGIPLVGVRYAPHPVGDLLLVASGVTWGIYTIAAKRLLARHDAMAVSAASLVVALPVLLPVAAIELPGFTWDAARLPAALAATVLLGLVVSAGMTVLWNRALRELDASRMAGFIFLQPLAGLGLAAFVLGEPVSGAAIGGGALVLAGVYVLVVEERAQPRRPAPSTIL
jgi:drug/metabolite transporter (DMT)-like permease